MIAIINYGSGNVGAIANIYKQLKIPFRIAQSIKELEDAERYVLPGVGAFDTTMGCLRQSGVVDMLNEQVLGKRKKVLGICVGMQIMAESSEEGELPGLGWIPGRVRKIDPRSIGTMPKLPHMGWNSVRLLKETRLFDGVDQEHGFYFLHSYYLDASNEDDVLATVSYGKNLPCAVVRGSAFGVQYHPEKSHANGIAVFRNFASLP